MSSEGDRATHTCGTCGARVIELRRGRCWHCYARWSELRPVGKGATCALCQERRRDELRLVELHGRSLPLCHGCGARALRLVPLPHSLEEIRTALDRERRRADRRHEALDHRIFPRERRVDERRAERLAPTRAGTDPAFGFGEFDDLVIEIDEDDEVIIEQTVVQQRAEAPEARAESPAE